MSAQMPELGSKITLISRADIRYEGRLYTVDPNECTIALANVRSFGTEDRETQCPVPAQNHIYDFILFRGKDIKDIRVITTQLPNDPAIVQVGPPSMNQQAGYQTPGFNHQVMGSSMPQYPGYGGMSGIPSGNMGLQRAPGPLMMQPISFLDLIGGVSRSTTPSITRKSPTNDQGTQVNNSPARDDNKKPRPIHPPQRDRDGRRDQQMYQSGQGSQRDKDYQGGNRKDYQNRDRDNQFQRRGNRNRDNQGRDDRDQRDQGQGQNRCPPGWVTVPQRSTTVWMSRGDNRQRGNRMRGPPKQFGRMGGPIVKKSTLKFDGDYDFDKANTEFEELRSQLLKVKIGSGSEGKVNGESEKKDDSGNETGAGENEQEEESIPEPCYDKSKSFFDMISCEAIERSKGRTQRTDWHKERKLNSETFGVASARRGGYRGRGYYGGRGFNRQQGGLFRPRGQPRTDRNNGQAEVKQQNATEETNESQKNVPVQAAGAKAK
ncbi:UNVERIFIED_CONTAM: hypothetical protein PYX00_008215 [Menopon gallinae]|uniref:Uncharacterized protein n=1 Tax=Menopon gallinae TaxID=328185 RepID=A0AAW2HM45_9NEOP